MEAVELDAPFAPGHSVRVQRFSGVPYNDGATRHWFRVWIDHKMSTVLHTNVRREGQMLCSDHNVEGTCLCRQAVARFMEDEAA